MNYYLIKIKQLINNFAVGPRCGSCGVCACERELLRRVEWDETKRLPREKSEPESARPRRNNNCCSSTNKVSQQLINSQNYFKMTQKSAPPWGLLVILISVS